MYLEVHDRSTILRRLHARRDRLAKLLATACRKPAEPFRWTRKLQELDSVIEDAARGRYRMD
jgi:hypothetical protein